MKLKDLEASDLFVFQRDLDTTPDLLDNHILTLSRVMRVLEYVTEGLSNKPYPKVYTIANGGTKAFPVDELNADDEVVRVTSLDLKDAVTKYERDQAISKSFDEVDKALAEERIQEVLQGG